MITIGVINSKGGSGKTTLASALAVRAVKESRLVAMCDLDPQLSLVEWWRRRGACENPTIFEGADEAGDAIERAELAGYEWLFLDSPPAFLQIVQDCVQAVDFALVPIKPSMLDLLATQDTIAIAREANTPFLCVLNDVVRGEKVVDGAREFLRKHGVPIADTIIHHRVSHIKAMTVGKSAAEVGGGKDTAAAKEIDDLWREVRAAATKAARARARRKAVTHVS